MTDNVNDHLVLVCGKSATGKSACLRNLPQPEGVMYLNCEAGKKVPFPAKFQQYTITDPLQVYEAFDLAEQRPEIHTIVVDSGTYLMDMFESVYVLNSPNTMKAWGDFAQYWKNLMQVYVARSTKNVIFTAHTFDQLNEKEMAMETYVPVKGALKNQGIESYFSVVIATKKVTTKSLENYGSDMLNLDAEDEANGFKYVFQTKLTRDTVGERIRGPMGMWDTKETFIDNDISLVLQRLYAYYGQEAAA